MKLHKITLCSLIIGLLVTLVGCNNSTSVYIDRHEWGVSTIQTSEDGAVIACSEEKKTTYDSAVEIEMSCTAKNGSLKLTDTTNGNTYEGTYEQTESSKEEIIYEITLVEESGNAVSSMTVYQDENKAPTLIISIADYVLTFFSKQKN